MSSAAFRHCAEPKKKEEIECKNHTFLIQTPFVNLQYSFEHFSAVSSVVHLAVIQFLPPRPPRALEVDGDWIG